MTQFVIKIYKMRRKKDQGDWLENSRNFQLRY